MDGHAIINIALPAAVAVVLIAALVAFYRLTLARASSLLRRRADQNGFELLKFEWCGFSGGFGPLSTSPNQIVYFVTVRSRDSKERSGWVRCGSWASFIFLSKEAEVK